MNKKILLIQPPYGSIFDLAFGTVPALTAALRTKGYEVVQRDLNVETFLQLLDPDFFEETCNLFRKKLAALPALKYNELKFMIDRFESERPKLKRLKAAIASEIKQGKFKYTTASFSQDLYKRYINIIRRFSEASEVKSVNGKVFFSRVDDHEYNLYYSVFDTFIKSVQWKEIFLVGITLSGSISLSCFTLARMIGKRFPRIHIVLGGDLFNYIDFDDELDKEDVRELFLKKYAHSIVVYEGDSAIVNIAECLTGKKSWDSVPNFVRLDNGELKINRPFYYEKIEDVPPFDFEGFPLQYYGGIPIEVTRGCYWGQCTFCRHYRVHFKQHEYSSALPSYRAFDPEKIVSTIALLKNKYKKDIFDFACFAISPPDMERLCNAIIHSGLQIKFASRVRLDKSFTPELFNIMKKAGAYYYDFYPETLSQRTADLHNKNYDFDHIKNLIAYWHRNRRHLPFLRIAIIRQFPGETYEDFVETFNAAKNGVFEVQYIRPYTFCKHSDVYYHPDKYGLKIQRGRGERLFKNFKVIWGDDVAREKKKIEVFCQENEETMAKIIERKDVRGKAMYDHRPGDKIFTKTI